MKSYKRVALIGLDGSGKSANIDKMKSDSSYGDYEFMWVRWKPILLKPAYWLMGKRVKNSKTTEQNIKNETFKKNSEYQKKLSAEYSIKSGMKGKIFKNCFIRKIWMNLALVDYLIQFYVKTIVLLLGKKSIIFDRFYLDLFVDQGINFGYSPEKIDGEIKKYQKLFPKMNYIIYLRVSPETCYKRKDDIPDMDYLLKRYNIYEELCKNPGWIIVDGELSFEQVYNDVKQKILLK